MIGVGTQARGRPHSKLSHWNELNQQKKRIPSHHFAAKDKAQVEKKGPKLNIRSWSFYPRMQVYLSPTSHVSSSFPTAFPLTLKGAAAIAQLSALVVGICTQHDKVDNKEERGSSKHQETHGSASGTGGISFPPDPADQV